VSGPEPVAPISFAHTATPGMVSCVIPVYNGERFLGEALESVFAQTFSHYEVVVVDDGSEDGTPTILKGYGDRIRSLRQDNQGPSAARNLGMRESRGEFISFIDADDLWVDNKLEVQMARIRESPNLELVSGQMKSFWVPELEEEAQQLETHPFHAARAVLSPCTVLFRRTLAKRIGGFDVRLRHGEDTEWFMRMMKSGTAYEVLPRLLLHRRQHLNNLTRQVRPSQDRLMDLIKRSLDQKRGLEISEVGKDGIARKPSDAREGA